MCAHVLNLILTHQPPEKVGELLSVWRGVSASEDILVAYGGPEGNFTAIQHSHKYFVQDPALRTKDHQRERQSYAAIFQGAVPYLSDDITHIYFAEFDHIPLVPDLKNRQLRRMEEERADVMAHQLRRIDRTNSPHYLYHVNDPEFSSFLGKISLRPDPHVVLSMLGTGSLWTKEAFAAIAGLNCPTKIYLELHMPTLVHHLGYRIRSWGDQDAFVQNLPSPELTIANAQSADSWTIHPIKNVTPFLSQLL